MCYVTRVWATYEEELHLGVKYVEKYMYTKMAEGFRRNVDEISKPEDITLHTCLSLNLDK